MSVLILTGPPGSDKTAIAERYARHLSHCAVIDVALVRAMVVQPLKSPWEGEEGKVQQALAIENACMLAKNFDISGYDVVILDALSQATALLYQEELAELRPRVVLLLPTLTEIQRRNEGRTSRLPDKELHQRYEHQQQFHAYDEFLDTSEMSAEEVAARLAKG